MQPVPLVDLGLGVDALFGEKVEVATLAGLKNVLGERRSMATLIMRRGWRPFRFPAREFSFVGQQIELSCVHIVADGRGEGVGFRPLGRLGDGEASYREVERSFHEIDAPMDPFQSPIA